MDKKRLMSRTEVCKIDIVQALLEFVRDNGEDCGDYERNEFGLECDDGRVTKVLNFFDNNGCYFFQPDKVNDDSLCDMTEENCRELLYEHTVHTAYQCLYIVEDANGNEQLSYYRFTNGGLTWDDDQSEPDHGYAMMLPLLDLNYILDAINQNF